MKPDLLHQKYFVLLNDLSSKFNLKSLGGISLTGSYRVRNKDVVSDKIVYICASLKTGDLLKVGQTTNWTNRLTHYDKKDEELYYPIYVFMFEAQTWIHQDLAERQVRQHLDVLGFDLAWDKTDRKHYSCLDSGDISQLPTPQRQRYYKALKLEKAT